MVSPVDGLVKHSITLIKSKQQINQIVPYFGIFAHPGTGVDSVQVAAILG